MGRVFWSFEILSRPRACSAHDLWRIKASVEWTCIDTMGLLCQVDGLWWTFNTH